MMEWLILLAIVGGIVSTVVWLLFWGGIAWLGVKAAQRASGHAFGAELPFAGLDPQFADVMRQLQTLIAQAQAQVNPHQISTGTSRPFPVPPHVQQQFETQIRRA